MSFTFDPDRHLYKLNDQILPSVTQVLKSEGFINTKFYDDYGADRGSKVHLMCHLYDMGELDEDTLDPALVPYLEGWKKFLGETGWKVKQSETPIYHKTLLYAGTPDKVIEIGKELGVPDIKSGAVEPWTALQLAAYAEALGGKLRRYAVQLPGDGLYKLHPFEDRGDRQVWLSALATYNWKRNHMKGRV